MRFLVYDLIGGKTIHAALAIFSLGHSDGHSYYPKVLLNVLS